MPKETLTIELIESKLNKMNTDLNKLSYIEIALKDPGFSFEIKRFLLEKAAILYETRKMYEKAAKALVNKGAMEVTAKERTETYLKAAELYSLCGKVEEAEGVFIRSAREVSDELRKRIRLARKNMYMHFATENDKQGKRANALKFYEKLLKIKLEPIEAEIVKKKTIELYKALGMFHEARLLEKK